jgi:hypothetical protein
MVTLAERQKVVLESFVDGKPAGPAEVEVTETARPCQVKTCDFTVMLRNGGTCLLDLGVCRKGDAKEQRFLLMTAAVQTSDTATVRHTVPHRVVPPAPVAIPAPPVTTAVAAPPPSAPPTAVFNTPQVHADMMLLRLTPEIARAHGLTDSVTHCGEKQVEKLRAVFATKCPGCEVVSAPKMVLLDNQIGYFQSTNQVERPYAMFGRLLTDVPAPEPTGGQKLRVTPAVSADGRFVRMKLEAECVDPCPVNGCCTRACDVSTTVPDGGTVVIAVRAEKGAEPSDRMYLVTTSHVLRTPADLERLSREMTRGQTVSTLPVPAVHAQPVLASGSAQGIALASFGVRQVDSTPADRKAKAAEWVAAYENACAGAGGPNPAECALRALAEDPHCFARPGPTK